MSKEFYHKKVQNSKNNRSVTPIELMNAILHRLETDKTGEINAAYVVLVGKHDAKTIVEPWSSNLDYLELLGVLSDSQMHEHDAG